LKRLTLYARGFMTATVVCAAAIATALAFRFPRCEYCALFALMGGTLAAVLFFSTRKKLITAKTIADSAVIRIQPAVVHSRTGEDIEHERIREDLGIYVSCFGILLGTKIIEFNQNGIWLKSVEIGQDHITFGFGARGEEPDYIRLLYSRPDEAALAGIIESFRKETGVVPVVAE